MAYGDIGTVIDTLEYETLNSLYQRILHVSGDIYAIAHTDQNSDGKIATVEIDDAGAITDTVKATLTFEAGSADWIDFIHIAGNVFALIARNSSTTSSIYTVSISDDGLTLSNIANSAFETAAVMHQEICHVTGDVYAIVFSDTGASFCKIVTVTISAAGTIGPVKDTLTIDDTNGYHVSIINISDSVVAVVYNSTNYVIKVVTVTISDTGVITDPVTDTVTIDTADTWAPTDLCKCLGDVVLVTYQGPGGDGWAKSITITSAGVICASPIDSIEFDAANCIQNHVIHIGLGICAVVYQGYDNDGYCATVEVDIDGEITDTVKDSLEFNTENCDTPNIVHATGDIYAIAHRGAGNDGYLKTVDIGTPPVGGPQHEMIMGMGP